MSLFYKTINIMGKFIKVSRDDLYNKVRQSLSGYEVSGDTQNRLMTSVFHLVSYMEKEHLSDYTPDVGISAVTGDRYLSHFSRSLCKKRSISTHLKE